MKNLHFVKIKELGILKLAIFISFFLITLFSLTTFFKEGFVIQRDFNFPVFTDSFIQSHLPLWNNLTSQNNIEQLMRLPMRLPFVILAMIGIPMTAIVKLMIYQVFVVAAISIIIFLYRLTKKNKLNPISNLAILIFVALYFSFNPVSLQFTWELALFANLATLPLLFLVCLYQHRLSYLQFGFLISVIIILSIGHPFLFLFNIFLFSIFSIYLGNKKSYKSYLRVAYTGLILILLMTWFLLPYLSLNTTSANLGRAANLERTTFEIVSDNSFLKIFVSLRDKFVVVNTVSDNELFLSIQFFSLFFLIFVAVLPLMLRVIKRGIHYNVYLFSVVSFILCTTFSFGLESPIGELYWKFVNEFPLGWMFRSPLKFQLYQVFFLSVSIYLSVILLAHFDIFRKYQNSLIFILCFAISTSIFPGMYDFSKKSMNPIDLPEGYYDIVEKLEDIPDGTKVLWYPKYNESATDWSEGHHIAPFDMKSSLRPSYNMHWGPSHIYENLYVSAYNYRLFASDKFYDFLGRINVEYLVFHDDRNQPIDKAVLGYLNSNLDLLHQGDEWYLFKNRSIINPKIMTYPCVEFSFSMFDVSNEDCIITSDYSVVEKASPDVLMLSKNNEIDFAKSLLDDDDINYLDTTDFVNSNGWQKHETSLSWASELYGYSFDLLQNYSNPFDFREKFSSYSATSIPDDVLSKNYVSFKDVELIDVSGEWTVNLDNLQSLNQNISGASVSITEGGSSSGWKKLKSPIFTVNKNQSLVASFRIGENSVDNLHVKMIEFDDTGSVIGNSFGHTLSKLYGTGQYDIQINPRSESVSQVGLEFWYWNIDENNSSRLSVRDFQIFDLTSYRQFSSFTLSVDGVGGENINELYLKSTNSFSGGEVQVKGSNKILGAINTKLDHSETIDTWSHFEFDDVQEFSFVNKGGYNTISNLFIVEKGLMDKKKIQIEDIFKHVPDGDFNSDIRILSESSTHYKIEYSSKKPQIISLAESFDGGWYAMIDGSRYDSFMLNSINNGFYLPPTGEEKRIIEIIYGPQKLFYTGLKFSFLFLFLIFGFLLWRYFPFHQNFRSLYLKR